MDNEPLHDWDLSPKYARALQVELASKIREEELPEAWETIAGVDVSSSRWDPQVHATVVVWRKSDGQIVATGDYSDEAEFPYIPGFLGFREVPVLLHAFKRLEQLPDVILVDGHGRSHPRGFGVACHLGLWLDRPTIGCAKSKLFGKHDELGEEAGSTVPLMNGAERIGTLLRSKAKCLPLYVSVGHRVTLAGAEEVVRACLRGYRLTEPIRHAHLRSIQVRRGEV